MPIVHNNSISPAELANLEASGLLDMARNYAELCLITQVFTVAHSRGMVKGMDVMLDHFNKSNTNRGTEE